MASRGGPWVEFLHHGPLRPPWQEQPGSQAASAMAATAEGLIFESTKGTSRRPDSLRSGVSFPLRGATFRCTQLLGVGGDLRSRPSRGGDPKGKDSPRLHRGRQPCRPRSGTRLRPTAARRRTPGRDEAGDPGRSQMPTTGRSSRPCHAHALELSHRTVRGGLAPGKSGTTPWHV